LESYIRTGARPKIQSAPAMFEEKRGAFVTLKIDGRLRGCIGYILPEYPCLESVIDNTISACARDPRFPPVKNKELDQIDIEISILTPPEPIPSKDEIEIGKHGVILKKGYHRAVFLPQVAEEQNWGVEETLTHLSMKAGLGPDGWKNGADFEVFEAQVFGELDLGRQNYPLTLD